MARMTGGEAIVKSLHREGVRVVFGLPGVQLYGVIAALREASEPDRARLHALVRGASGDGALGELRALGAPSEVLTRAHLSPVYGLPVNVLAHPVYGTPLVLPDGRT